ncbi:hypothetical protein [Fibrella forsythiae]|uniref:Uncharacterized protein n=1 Tax=Fibrella forsythiae TaxID=2817061 RepID=A0ABS3JG68_9BACT|nr:hypothetical protein [Fibrella forsythiae]MBO0948994.1 hypothetical protein [Fibrella forsythiae]
MRSPSFYTANLRPATTIRVLSALLPNPLTDLLPFGVLGSARRVQWGIDSV